MHALLAFSIAATVSWAAAKPVPSLPPDPAITPPPVPLGEARLKGRDPSVPLTIPLASCLASVECCETILTLPVLPADFTTLLPISAPVPIPTLGPLAGLVCSPATDLNILGNQCLQGGTAVCCQQDVLGLVAEGCQEVVVVPPITIPSLPIPLPTSLPLPISLPPILGGGGDQSSSGLLGLPLPSIPLLGGDNPSPTSSGLLGLPLPSIPLLGGDDPTPTSSGLLGLPLPSLPLLGREAEDGGGLLGLPILGSGGLLGLLPLPSLPLLGGLGLGGSAPTPAPAPAPAPPKQTSSGGGGLLGLPISLPLGLVEDAAPTNVPAKDASAEPTSSQSIAARAPQGDLLGGLLGILGPILGGSSGSSSGGLLGLPISLPLGLVEEGSVVGTPIAAAPAAAEATPAQLLATREPQGDLLGGLLGILGPILGGGSSGSSSGGLLGLPISLPLGLVEEGSATNEPTDSESAKANLAKVLAARAPQGDGDLLGGLLGILGPILGGDSGSDGGLLGLPISLPLGLVKEGSATNEPTPAQLLAAREPQGDLLGGLLGILGPILGGDSGSSGGLLGLPISLPLGLVEEGSATNEPTDSESAKANLAKVLAARTPQGDGLGDLLGGLLGILGPILGGDSGSSSGSSGGLLGLPISLPLGLVKEGSATNEPTPAQLLAARAPQGDLLGGLLGILGPILGGSSGGSSGGLLGLPISLPLGLVKEDAAEGTPVAAAAADSTPASTLATREPQGDGGLLGLPLPILGGGDSSGDDGLLGILDPILGSGGLLGLLPLPSLPLLGGGSAPAPTSSSGGGLLGLPISLPLGLATEVPVGNNGALTAAAIPTPAPIAVAA